MTAPAVRHTHHIRRDGDVMIKTYRTWDRAEPEREWAALRRIDAYQPGLVPHPVRADLAARPPSITIGIVPGEPVFGRWSDRQLDLLATALRRLWTVPAAGLQPIGVHRPAYWRSLAARSRPPDEAVARIAYVRSRDWIEGAELDAALADRGPVILGQGDPQIGNLLSDGAQVRLVDFEDAGPSDPAFELANFAEHLGNRGSGLDRVAERFEVDPEQLHVSRILLAAFWLFLLSPDPAGSGPARTEELGRQARRILQLLDGEIPDDAAAKP